mgnify:FL=1
MLILQNTLCIVYVDRISSCLFKVCWTEVEYNNSKHLIMKEDDIVGILESDDVKDMKPLND